MHNKLKEKKRRLAKAKQSHLKLPDAGENPTLCLRIRGVPQFSRRAKTHLYVGNDAGIQKICHVLSEALHEVSVNLHTNNIYFLAFRIYSLSDGSIFISLC